MGIPTRLRAGWHGGRGTALLTGTVVVLITVLAPAGTAAAAGQAWKIQKTANVTVPNGTAAAGVVPVRWRMRGRGLLPQRLRRDRPAGRELERHRVDKAGRPAQGRP
jgi:anti-sigma factor ChrR (cupin superfamily)